MANRLHIVIRPLRSDDLELFFEPVERAVGEEWLARQERGELYVAVAELEGTPAGRRCLDFTYYAAERSGFCFAVFDQEIGSILVVANQQAPISNYLS